MEDMLYTAQEVADILKIKKNTVYELVKRGELPSKKVGKQVRISTQDINKYLSISKVNGAVSQTPIAVAKPNESALPENIILCGQDISLDIIVNCLSSIPDIPNILRSHAGSYNSLHYLYQGKVTIATTHLWDETTRTYNYPYIPKLIPGIPVVVIRLFGRMQGFYIKKGNPKNITGWQDLERDDLIFANREKGSGTRVLLDEKLKAMSINRNNINGYKTEYNSHLTVAGAVVREECDYGLGSEQGCLQFAGIDFIPMQSEWYDMVFFADQEDSRAIKAILDFICSDKFLSELSAIGGYDISQTGKIVRL